jgi:hypothetical protein
MFDFDVHNFVVCCMLVSAVFVVFQLGAYNFWRFLNLATADLDGRCTTNALHDKTYSKASASPGGKLKNAVAGSWPQVKPVHKILPAIQALMASSLAVTSP